MSVVIPFKIKDDNVSIDLVDKTHIEFRYLLSGVATAFDFLAGLNGTDDDADGHHDDGDILGELVAPAEVVHARQHACNQASLLRNIILVAMDGFCSL
jgi:hypothetical protein